MLTDENFLHTCLRFEDRQAGVSTVYCHQSGEYYYHAYCVETTVFKDLVSCEFDGLDEALAYINDEFATWELVSFSKDDGCGSCHAK